MSKTPEIVLFDQPVRAEILLSGRWDTKTIPAFRGTGDQFYDRYIAKNNKEAKQARKEGELETAPTTTTIDPAKEMEIKNKKHEAVFQLLLQHASELSALVRSMTTPVQKQQRRTNDQEEEDDVCNCR